MATVQALVPIMAHNFCESRTTTLAFDIVSSSSATASSSTPDRKRNSHQSKRDSPRVHSPKGANDIFSLTDAALAERYQFIEEIGYGNWGSVWKCRPKADPSPSARVAIKLVHRSKNPTSSARVRSLWQEFKCIRALRPLSHPSIVTMHSFTITPSYSLIAMAYHPRLMPVELPETKCVSYFRQLISAVDFLHSNGCSHNDIKPANILLSDEDRPVLVDFGFAQMYDLSNKDRFLSSLSWGTPEYLSPERARGVLHDERLSDVWALGVTLYEIVVGRTPFEKTESEEFLSREALEVYYHRTTSSAFCGTYSISEELENLLHQMVEPNTNLRLALCSDALRHPFFAPPLHQLHASRSLIRSSDSQPSATPPRTSPAGGTPTSSTQKGGRKAAVVGVKPNGIKVFQDSDSPSPSRISRPTSIGTPSRVLAERNRPNSIILAKGTPSKIPVRKVDISHPVTLVKKSTTPHKTNAGSPTAARKSTTLRRTTSQGAIDAIPPLPTSTSSGSIDFLAKKQTLPPSHPPFTAFAPSSLARPPPTPTPTPPKSSTKRSTARSSPPTKAPYTQSSRATRAEEKKEVLKPQESEEVDDDEPKRTSAFSVLEGFKTRRNFFSRGPSGSTASRGSDLDYTPSPSFDETAFAMNETMPLPTKSSSSLASKFRKMSLRRAPSAISFRGAVPHHRPSSTSSSFSLVDVPGKKKSAAARSLGRATGKRAAASQGETERERLESFSKHIQFIIDARKRPEPLPKRSIAPKPSSSNLQNPVAEIAILSPSEIQEFRQQVAEELAEDRRNKSLSQEETAGPRARRSSTISRPGHSPHAEPVTVKIRPSLAPSFIASSPPQATRSPAESSSVGSIGSGYSADALTATFKPGHRRIPTAIRSVPSILLTESADDESESEWARSETPGSVYSFERVASPPPTPRVVEEGRQLPIWVPEEDSDDDGDVDEPTITIISTPSKLKKRPSNIRRSPTHHITPSASSGGLFQQFVKATPGVARRGRASTNPTQTSPPRPPPATTTFAPPPAYDPRSSSRATTRTNDTSDTSHSRKRSVVSFFFHSASRPITPSPSLASTSSVSMSASDASGAEDEGKPPRKAGRIKRALKKLLQ